MSRAGHLGFGVALLRGLLARYIVAGFPGCILWIGSFRGRAGETGKRRHMAGRVLTGGMLLHPPHLADATFAANPASSFGIGPFGVAGGCRSPSARCGERPIGASRDTNAADTATRTDDGGILYR